MDKEDIKRCERFKEVRKDLGLKQGVFAKEIKTTQGHVSDIENKRKGVSDRVIEIICLKYGYNEEWLRNGTLPKKPIDKLSTYLGQIKKGNDELIKDLIMAYMELDPDSKKALQVLTEKMYQNRKERG